MSNITILFSGVHGVGKGYFTEHVLRNNTRMHVVTASLMIGEYKKAADAGYKMVSDINGNQNLLLHALWKEMDKYDTIILDGHLTLVNNEKEIQKIPESFIRDVPFDGIVLLQDNPQSIVSRQRKRDNLSLEESLLERMQKEELDYCRLLYEKYRIPYLVIGLDASIEQFSEIFSLIGENNVTKKY